MKKSGAKKFRFEQSAGGLVIEDGLKTPSTSSKILMIEVKNLKGEIVWTFPKGHLEKGETPEQAARREVWEETGWECALADPSKPFERVRYFFRRENQLVRKEVIWFMMRPVSMTGKMDAEEIRKVEWVTVTQAQQRAVYPSDKKLLAKLTSQASRE